MCKYFKNYPHENYDKYKPLLKIAFKELRKQGIIAKMNFMCCSTCAGAAIATYLEGLCEEKRDKIKGCAYWHKQSESSFKENGMIYIQYGIVDTEYGEIGLPTIKVGKMIVNTLKKHNIPVKWNGDENKCIGIGV